MRSYSFRLGRGRLGFLLLHGLAGTPVEMRPFAEALASAGYTVSCPQLAGHCGSVDDLKAYTWQDWAATAEAALDELRETCDFVVVGGLSTGALLSLWLAAKRPRDVQGAVAFAPTLWLNGWVVPWYARLFRLVTQKWFANLIDFPDLPPHGVKSAQVRARIAEAFASGDNALCGQPVTPGGAVLEHRWLMQAVTKRLGEVTQPVLIVHSREDDYADLDNVLFLMRRLGGIVDTVVLDDCYHIITSDQQRHMVGNRTIEFVNRIRREHRWKEPARDDPARREPQATALERAAKMTGTLSA
ncbi:MAG: alpha/beta fold hydrolase [Hyphomicrobiaceae bacterium]|nr:alpha/beta fold hydrolase [Hyphomicrobiaceae bacterium]